MGKISARTSYSHPLCITSCCIKALRVADRDAVWQNVKQLGDRQSAAGPHSPVRPVSHVGPEQLLLLLAPAWASFGCIDWMIYFYPPPFDVVSRKCVWRTKRLTGQEACLPKSHQSSCQQHQCLLM